MASTMGSPVSGAAATALATCGYAPRLVVGDGLEGHPDGAPYDRTVAACGVLDLPSAWIEQTRPGGIVLATLSGWLYSSELARLTVTGDGTAHGRFLGDGISFMLARPHQPPPLGLLPDLDDGEERRAHHPPDILDDWNTRFVAQLAAPRTQNVTLQRDGHTERLLIDVALGAWALLYQDGPAWIVRQGGPERLWDAVESHVTQWRADGAPPLERFDITITDTRRTITWPSA